ncbi:MAG: PQQ-binding-like beta-propeller repeat protein [Pseudomonadota bacterium]
MNVSARNNPFSVIAALAGALTVAGCGAVDTVSNGISAINPFDKSDDVLPGERLPVFPEEMNAIQDGQTGAALAIAAPATRSDWVQAGGSLSNNPGHVAFRSGGIAAGWRSATIGGAGLRFTGMGKPNQRVFSRPVVSGGRIFVYSPDGEVTALALNGGSTAWKVSLRPDGERDIAAGGGVAVDNGFVYAATGYGSLGAIDAATGTRVWTKDLDSPARGAPSAGNGMVFVVTQDNTVLAVNQTDGSEIWRFDGIPELAGLLAASNPAISGSRVVVPYKSGELVAFDMGSGEPVWSDAVSRPSRAMAITGLNDVSASPVVSEGIVYAAGVGGRLIAVSLNNGERVWELDVGSTHTPVVSGDGLFMVSVDNRAVGINRRSGEISWSRKLPQHTKNKKKQTTWAGPVLAGGQLWFVSGDGKLVSVDPANGALGPVTRMRDPSYISPLAVSGQLLVLSDKGSIVSYR